MSTQASETIEDVEVEGEVGLNETLITLVNNNPIIYNNRSRDNLNRVAKEIAWTSISGEIDKPVIWCQNQWRKLTQGYKSRKKRIIGKTGQAKKKIESWPYYESLKFLDDYIHEAETTSNITRPATVGALNTVLEVVIHDEGSNQLNAPSPTENMVSPGSSCSTSSAQGQITPRNNMAKGKASMKRKRDLDELDQELLSIIKKPDECELFCLNIAEEMKTMTPKQKSEAKIKISQVMFDIKYSED